MEAQEVSQELLCLRGYEMCVKMNVEKLRNRASTVQLRTKYAGP